MCLGLREAGLKVLDGPVQVLISVEAIFESHLALSWMGDLEEALLGTYDRYRLHSRRGRK